MARSQPRPAMPERTHAAVLLALPMATAHWLAAEAARHEQRVSVFATELFERERRRCEEGPAWPSK